MKVRDFYYKHLAEFVFSRDAELLSFEYTKKLFCKADIKFSVMFDEKVWELASDKNGIYLNNEFVCDHSYECFERENTLGKLLEIMKEKVFLSDENKPSDYDEILRINKQKFFDEFSFLSLMTLEALWKIADFGKVNFVKKGDSFETVIEDEASYRLSLSVDNLEPSKSVSFEEYYIEGTALTFSGNRFCLSCIYENFEDESIEEIDFYFSDPVGKIEVLNCCKISDRPWEDLAYAASQIIRKAELSYDLCSDEEKALLPLFKEVCRFYYISEEKLKFEHMRRFAAECGFDKIEKLLKKSEGLEIKTYKDNLSLQKILSVLNKAEYEPMWRKVYQKIYNSQKRYPKSHEIYVDGELLEKLRREIEVRFLSAGYSGAYPDFYKEGSMRGLHLSNSYGMSYFVGMKKSVKFFIHCEESCDENGCYCVEFLSGTDLTKCGKCEDIYSCLFNGKGKRLYSKTLFIHNADNLAFKVSVALKRAECKALDKKEKKHEYKTAISPIKQFIFLFVLAGGFFSVFFNLLFFPLMYGVFWLLGGREGFGEFLASMPWLFSLIFTWVGFGGAFGIIDVLSKGK